jgi:hypothetical protein
MALLARFLIEPEAAVTFDWQFSIQCLSIGSAIEYSPSRERAFRQTTTTLYGGRGMV